MARRAALALAASVTLALGTATGAGAAPKPKPPPPSAGTLVALGDSFSAGTGTFARVNDCYQSPYAYPVLVASRLGTALDFRACEGATTTDVFDQVAAKAWPSTTSRVTMTAGGNDVGFADVLTTCALPFNTSSCLSAIEAGRSKLPDLGTALLDLYATVKSVAPNATVTVAGYPHLFNGSSDCSLLTFFDTTEMSRLNAATDELDALTATQARTAGVNYLDPRAAFDNHAVCDSTPYINGYSSPIEESYHPNRAGNVAYADLFAPSEGGGKGGGKPRAATRTMSIDEQADYVARLGLDSPESLAKAQAAGLEAREIRSLVGQLRSGNEAAQLAALKRLEVLDEQVAARAR